jgi:hypothetical protein
MIAAPINCSTKTGQTRYGNNKILRFFCALRKYISANSIIGTSYKKRTVFRALPVFPSLCTYQPHTLLCNDQLFMPQSIDRVLSFFSGRRNWDSHNPSLKGQCAPAPPPRFWGEGHTRWRERGLGESQFRRGDIHCAVVLFIYSYFVVHAISRGPFSHI